MVGVCLMVRDFTEATKEKLLKQIDDINKSTWNPVSDFIGDAFLYGVKWIGLLSLYEDMSNVKSYHKIVLDMTDMTKKELNRIFEEVYAVDREFSKNISVLNEQENIYNSKMYKLSSMIKPGFSICDAKTIKSAVSEYNERLKAVNWKVNEIYEKELDWAAKQAVLNSAKGFVSNALNIVVDLVTLPVDMVKNIVTGRPDKIFTDTWSLINDVFAVGSNMVGIAALGIGYAASGITGNREMKHEAIKSSEAYGGAEGLTDVLDANEKVNGKSAINTLMKKISQIADISSAGIGLVDDSKGFFEKPSSMVVPDSGIKKELEPLKKKDIIDKYKDGYRYWQSLYRKLGTKAHYVFWNNISKIYKYLDSLWDMMQGRDVAVEGVKKDIAKSNKIYGSLCDAYETGEDIADVLFDIF